MGLNTFYIVVGILCILLAQKLTPDIVPLISAFDLILILTSIGQWIFKKEPTNKLP